MSPPLSTPTRGSGDIGEGSWRGLELSNSSMERSRRSPSVMDVWAWLGDGLEVLSSEDEGENELAASIAPSAVRAASCVECANDNSP